MKTLTATALCLAAIAAFVFPTVLAQRRNDLRYLILYILSFAVTMWCVMVMRML
ncbi:MAG: hypothetical protein IJ365_02520 [Clostridia bacterium]|nr:hypothetical protein [Clostridia bacterium]